MGRLDIAAVKTVLDESVLMKLDTPARHDFYFVGEYLNKDDSLITTILRDSLGNIVGLNQRSKGATIFASEYYANGQEKGDVPFTRDGKLTGKAVYYYENGKIRSSGRLANGIRVGEWKEYDEDGNLKVEK